MGARDLAVPVDRKNRPPSVGGLEVERGRCRTPRQRETSGPEQGKGPLPTPFEGSRAASPAAARAAPPRSGEDAGHGLAQDFSRLAPHGPDPETDAEQPASEGPAGLIVEDDVTDLQPGQLRRSEFLDRLHAAVCEAAEAELAGTERSTTGCPYLAFWFDYYRRQSGAHVEAALRRYAPEARDAGSASEYIPLVATRVRQGVARWVDSGEISGVPDGVPTSLPGPGGPGGLAAAAGSLFFKSGEGGVRDTDDPEAVQRALGDGGPLDSRVRSRMERAFGRSFAHVRAHTDTTAKRLSSRQNARAFTVGRDVAFGPGQYQPGTVVGDALIAHELAHVVQQDAPGNGTGPGGGAGPSSAALERDADFAAVGAVASLWGEAGDAFGDVGAKAAPGLRSGLRLSRCSSSACTTRTEPASPVKTVTVRPTHLWGGRGSSTFDRDLNYANQVYAVAGVRFTKGNEETIDEADTKDPALLGADALLDDSGTNPQPSSYTAEETGLMGRNGASGELTAYYIKGVENSSGLLGRAFLRDDGFLILPPARQRTFPHEVGHFFFGLGHPGNNDNLMAQTRSATGVDCLTDEQIEAARSHRLVQ